MASSGNRDDGRIFAVVFGVVYAYTLYSWIADQGVIPWFEYQEMALMGSYTPVVTPIAVLIFPAPVFAAILSNIVISVRDTVRRAGLRFRSAGTARSSHPAAAPIRYRDDEPAPPPRMTPAHAKLPAAAAQSPPAMQPPPTVRAVQSSVAPPTRPASVVRDEPQIMPARAMLIWALLFTAVAVGFGALINFTANYKYTYETFDIAKGGTPRTNHVELIGVEHPELQFVLTTSGKHYESHTTYIPLLPPHWTADMPVVYVVEMRDVNAGDGNFHLRDDTHPTLSRDQGHLGHLPGIAAYGFTRHGLKLGSPHFALKADGFDDSSMSFGVMAISAILALTFWLCGLMFALTNRRVRRSQRLRS